MKRPDKPFLERWKDLYFIYGYFEKTNDRLFKGLVIEFYLDLLKLKPFDPHLDASDAEAYQMWFLDLFIALKDHDYDEAFSKIQDILNFDNILYQPHYDMLKTTLEMGFRYDAFLHKLVKE